MKQNLILISTKSQKMCEKQDEIKYEILNQNSWRIGQTNC